VTPFTDPTPKGEPPYHLRGPDPLMEALHLRLMKAMERAQRERLKTRAAA
jgi:hypothetical protein